MEVFLNKNANDETNKNNEIFNEYFKYHNLSFLVKRLYNANQTRNEKTVNQVNEEFKFLKMKTQRKKSILLKGPWLYKQQITKELKISTPKQILQILPIALAQVTAGNTTDILLNETRQIIYSLNRAKEIITKKYNIVMNPISWCWCCWCYPIRCCIYEFWK